MTALTQALHAIDQTPCDELIRAKCKALMIGYDNRYASDNPYTTVDTEQIFRLPIVNPATDRPSRTFQ